MSALSIRVHGIPAPQGSKRHVGNGVMIESSKKVKPWREAVKWAAIDSLDRTRAVDRFDLRTLPVAVVVTFYLPRPKGHYRTGRNANLLRDAAPQHHATKPDVDKLIRSTLDAIGEAGVWRDDSQVAQVTAVKTYAGDLHAPGAHIEIRPLGGTA